MRAHDWLHEYGSHAGSFLCGTRLAATAMLKHTPPVQSSSETADRLSMLRVAAELKLQSVLPVTVDIQAHCNLELSNPSSSNADDEMKNDNIEASLLAWPGTLVCSFPDNQIRINADYKMLAHATYIFFICFRQLPTTHP